MKRRSFIQSSLIGATAAAVISPSANAAAIYAANDKKLTWYELRVYTLKNTTQQQLVTDYLKDAAIPVLNRLGVKNIGVFTELKPAGQTRIFVLIPYTGLDHFNTVNNKFENDPDLKSKGEAYLNAPAAQPAYERIESCLLKAFTHMPAPQPPAKKPRLFELRQYQSATEEAGRKKIDMFNNQGEIDIFKRLGFNPVFWGETVIGAQRPNLTYMLTFDDMDAKNAHWKAFGSDAEWKKISTMPENADALLVSKITSTLLVPTEFSQV